jgi:hypothetical protein
MTPSSYFAGILRSLARLRGIQLFGIFLGWFVLWSAAIYLLLDEIVPAEDQPNLGTLATSLMTAFGALFAFLTAFGINLEWGHHRDAEQTIGKEADAALRMAWASEAPECDGPEIRRELGMYLHTVIEDEWPTLAMGSEGSEDTHDCMSALQTRIRAIAAAHDLSHPVTTDLLKSADALAVARADRLNTAGHDLSTPLFALAFLSGVMLAINAIAVSLRFEPGYVLLIGGLIVLIAFDLALLVAIGTPFNGPLKVAPRPLRRMLDHLEAGRYGTTEQS